MHNVLCIPCKIQRISRLVLINEVQTLGFFIVMQRNYTVFYPVMLTVALSSRS